MFNLTIGLDGDSEEMYEMEPSVSWMYCLKICGFTWRALVDASRL